MKPITQLIPALLLLAIICPAQAEIVVGGISESRFGNGGGLDSSSLAAARAKLRNTDSFGSGAAYPEAISLRIIGGTITETGLADIDIFVLGRIPEGSTDGFSASEINDIKRFLRRGGSLILFCEDSATDAICLQFTNNFYSVQPGAASPSIPIPDEPLHPIMNAPFGGVANLGMAGAFGRMDLLVACGACEIDITGETGVATDTGDQVDFSSIVTVMTARYAPVLESGPTGRSETPSGRLVFATDLDFITQAGGLSSGSGISTDNDRFLGNLFAYVAAEARANQIGASSAHAVPTTSRLAVLLTALLLMLMSVRALPISHR